MHLKLVVKIFQRRRVGPLALVLQASLLFSLMSGRFFSSRVLADQAPVTIDLAKQGAADVAILGNMAGDRTRIVSIADVDGDGVDDMVIAAHLSSAPMFSRTNAGSVFVVFGGVDLTTGTVRDLGDRADVTIHGADPDDRFATSLVTGDVNGDGIADIVVGAPRANGPLESRQACGELYVIFGGPHLKRGTVRDMEGQVGPGADVIIFGASVNDHLGSSLSIGDINGDGIKDIIAGSANASQTQGPRLFSGTVYAVFGTADMTSGVVRDLSGEFAQGADLKVLGPSTLSFFGFQVVIGDVNGDGLSDIIASAPLADGPQGLRPDAGEVYVIFGDAGLTSGTVRDLASEGSSGAHVRIYGANEADLLGFAVAVADVTGDRVDDLIISANQADGPDEKRPDSGEVYIIFGGAPLTRASVRDIAGQMGPSADVTLFGAEAGDEFGASIAASDLDGNGIADLLVGAPGADASENAKVDAGEAYVFLDKGISTSGTVRDVGGEATLQPELIILGAVALDQLGGFVAISDVNADGFVDLILSAPESGGTKYSSGTIFVLFGPRF